MITAGGKKTKTKSLRRGGCQCGRVRLGSRRRLSRQRRPSPLLSSHPQSKKNKTKKRTISSLKAVTTSASTLIALATVIIREFKGPFVVFKGSSLQPPLSRLQLYPSVRLFLPRLRTSRRLNVVHSPPSSSERIATSCTYMVHCPFELKDAYIELRTHMKIIIIHSMRSSTTASGADADTPPDKLPSLHFPLGYRCTWLYRTINH